MDWIWLAIPAILVVAALSRRFIHSPARERAEFPDMPFDGT
jgi:hypothetical protein